MSTIVIVLIVLAAVVVALFVGGLLASRRRSVLSAGDYARHVAAADKALEQARAADKGWDRPIMEEAARGALRAERPGWEYDDLHLILVDDRPGVTEDRAHFAALAAEGEARVVLVRGPGGWELERIE